MSKVSRVFCHVASYLRFSGRIEKKTESIPRSQYLSPIHFWKLSTTDGTNRDLNIGVSPGGLAA